MSPFVDVLFPLNIGPLTYRHNSPLRPGTLVKAEIRKNLRYGLVIGRSDLPPASPYVKEIACIVLDEPVFTDRMLALLEWLSDYYVASRGLALKSMLPMDVFDKRRLTRKASKVSPKGNPFPDVQADGNIVSVIKESVVRKSGYRTYLLCEPSIQHELAHLAGIAKGLGGVIVLAPETSYAKRVFPVLKELFGERLVFLHGGLSRSGKRDAFMRMISGDADIVLGTRTAAFAPLRSVSLIFVLQEHNRSYKNPEGLRYHGRDVAVMRGYIEKVPVVLSSISPSVESFYNSLIGKYRLFQPAIKATRPRVEIINMKTSRKLTRDLSRRVVDAAALCLKKNDNILFLVNRRGYSLIRCSECHYIERCPVCGIPLVYHQSRKLLKCHYCGHTYGVSDTCRICNGPGLEMVGAGVEKIAHEIQKHFAVDPMTFDSESVKGDAFLETLADSGEKSGTKTPLLVGTSIVIRRSAHRPAFGTCAFLNPDMYLQLPDFRSAETLFQDLIAVSENVDPAGALLVQTRMPENHVLKNIKKYDLKGFYADELSTRKELSYPPFSRLALLTFISKPDISEKISAVIRDTVRNVEAVGPVRLRKKDKNMWRILLKSPSAARLNRCAKDILRSFANEKDLKIVIDIDPTAI